jgi:hypothetical protein
MATAVQNIELMCYGGLRRDEGRSRQETDGSGHPGAGIAKRMQAQGGRHCVDWSVLVCCCVMAALGSQFRCLGTMWEDGWGRRCGVELDTLVVYL